ncbi:hypothetical protein RvY_09552 [Ramazzottius varieornatus]|uniref:BTB domain-containing protein n=1 Tax=Ramazzottius varieornatus TaxID=947166 RepID=A0A1D1VBX8_RAMVA|nr:hypothetical protein RvY_09552 [Ramazzottius varieornatus]
MSSSNGMDEAPKEISHAVSLVLDFKTKLLESEEFSDLVLIVENTPLKVHRAILASRSEYFRALLYGGMKETKQNEIVLHDTDLSTFKILLEYIYTATVNVSKLRVEVLVGLLGLTNQYGFSELEKDLVLYMKNVLNVKNVCAVYEVSFGFGMHDLTTTCLKYVDRHARTLLHSREILHLSASALKHILVRDTLCASESDIFDLVREWCSVNVDDMEGKDILSSTVRWDLLSTEELVNRVRQSNLIPGDKILDVLASKMRAGSALQSKLRGFCDPSVNVATSELKATVIRGEMSGSLLDGDVTNFGMDHGYTRHVIPDKQDADKSPCIHVKLGMPCIINHLRLLLWDKDQRFYSFYVEVSNDGTSWNRVIDYRDYFCRSWQELYFATCTVQHIKVTGTRNTTNRSFHLVKLEAFYLETVPEIRSFGDGSGFIVPVENVMTLSTAIVTEGVSRTRNALINGSLEYDWDNGYCCHQIGSGAIMVALNQPYILSSLRLLLWDVDHRFYTYTIHSSATQKDWQLLVDTRDSPRQSWQSHKFPPRPISFLKLTGISNTANEVFHVVHLEAPSQADPAEVVPEAINPAAAPDVLVDVDFHGYDVPLDIQVLHPAAVVVAGPSNRVVNIPHPADVDEEQERGRHRRVRPRNNPR